MPTAGEYKHEPSGIPCHCYVRRRLSHSAGRKSCLRRQSDSSSQYSDSKSKKVTFNPVLSVRSYDNDSAKPPEPDSKKPSNGVHNEQASKNASSSSTLCAKLTSLFGLRHNKPSQKHDSEDRQKSSKDHNNNDIKHSDEMNAEQICPLCESKRNRSPVRGSLYQRTRERSPSPCGFHQPYPAHKDSRGSPQYQRYASTSEYSARNFRPTPSLPRRYHSPRRLFSRDSLSGTSDRGSSQGYENMDTLSYIARETEGTVCDIDGTIDLGRLTTYIGGKTNQIEPISIPITINPNTTEQDNLEEYIYETPINNKPEKDYEYVSIKSHRKPSASQTFEGNSITIPISETGTYPASLIKHKTEIDLTSDTIHYKRSRTRCPDPEICALPTIINCPYDIQFINERPKRPSPQHVEQEVEIPTECGTSENPDALAFGGKPPEKRSSPLADILKLTPLAFFWTGCAFIIAMVYVCLFPCPMDDEE